MKLTLVVVMAVVAMVTSSPLYEEKGTKAVIDLFRELLDLEDDSQNNSEHDSGTPFNCFVCTNNVNSDKGREYCMSYVGNDPDVPTEQCAAGVSTCYLKVENGLYFEAGEIKTLSIVRGCKPHGMTCDIGLLLDDSHESYTQCCHNNLCNGVDVVPFPTN